MGVAALCGAGEGAERHLGGLLLDHAAHGEEAARAFPAGCEAGDVDARGHDMGVGMRHAMGGEVVEQEPADREHAGEARHHQPVGPDPLPRAQRGGGIGAAPVGEDRQAHLVAELCHHQRLRAELGKDRIGLLVAQEPGERLAARAEGQPRGAVQGRAAQGGEGHRQAVGQRQRRPAHEERLAQRVLTVVAARRSRRCCRRTSPRCGG
ncbi:hypothetical protein [Ponticoccus litoralis]|uniref:hypothetical protein n=1 Tax=Ponticoccus litoralis TaxID=422297 RepID=UPI003D2ED32B